MSALDLRDSIIPGKFRRSGGSLAAPEFNNLRSIFSEPNEKQFLCVELEKAQNYLGLTGAKGAETRYGIPRRSIRDWLAIYRDPRKQFHEFEGRPDALSAKSVEIVHQELIAANTHKRPLTESQLSTSINTARDNEFNEAGKLPPIESLDPRTVKKIKIDNNIKNYKPQTLTLARERAICCPRVTYVWACLCVAFSAHTAAQYKWNTDATTIEINEDHTGALVCVVRDED
ncbi:hypothetical protein B484DRAFT_461402, partial [Ochromonadaceae sp. CCMP2298]